MSFAEDPHGFGPHNMAHSDDYLFLTDAVTRLQVYEFAADGGMPVHVRGFEGLKQPRGMAFHKTTGTLLVACTDHGEGVRLLDTRPPPSAWAFGATGRDRVPLEMAHAAVVRRPGSGLPAICIAMDEPNVFVYVATFAPQTITQFRASVWTADEKAAVSGGSTVDLKLTAVRVLEGAEFSVTKGDGQLLAIAVLSPSTLLLSHLDRTLSVLTHTAPDPASGGDADAADSKLAGRVGELRPISDSSSGPFATGIAVDHERRRVFVGLNEHGRVAVYDSESGVKLAEVHRAEGWGSAADVALINGVLVTADFTGKCLHFLAVDAIPGLT
jgi:hypothetical protein